MSLVRILALLGVMGGLSACASPLEQCLWQAERQAQDLREELAERRANATRGYRVEFETFHRMQPRICINPADGSAYSCSDWVEDVRRVRHPVNPEYEREQVALLERQLAREERRAAEAAAQCRATYPVE